MIISQSPFQHVIITSDNLLNPCNGDHRSKDEPSNDVSPVSNPSPHSKFQSIQKKINFFYYLEPFINMLATISTHLINIPISLLCFCSKVILAMQDIFRQLLFPTPFDPREKSFIDMIESIAKGGSNLQQRIDLLEERFHYKHLFSDDLEELKALNSVAEENLKNLEYFISTLNQHKYQLPILDQLDLVRASYSQLHQQIKEFCQKNKERIIETFDEIVNVFPLGIDLPKKIQKDLLRNVEILNEVLSNNYSFRLTKIRQKILEERTCIGSSEAISTESPLKIRNIESTSCYLDAVLQVLLSVKTICDELQKPETHSFIPSRKNGKESMNKRIIHQELLQFIQMKKMPVHQSSLLNYMLFLLEKPPSQYRLREAIFTSLLHPEFEKKSIDRQHDAAALMDFFIDLFLSKCCKFKWQEHTRIDEFPNLEFVGGPQELSMLPVPMNPESEDRSLMHLIRLVVGRHDEHSPRLFDPQSDSYVVSTQEHEASFQKEIKVEQYVQFHQFIELPPVLILHFKRSKKVDDAFEKDESPVDLPQDGIIDLSEYYHQKACYKIKGLIMHNGYSLNEGHYVSYVETNGKYYYCNDLDKYAYCAITENDFLRNKQAYLIVLERLSDA